MSLNLKEGSVRVWLKKGIVGVIYDESFVNNEEMRKNVLKRMSDDEVKEKLGVSIFEVEIVLNDRKLKEYFGFEDLEENCSYILYNYSFVKNVRFVKKLEIEESVCWIFENEKNEKFEIYKKEELEKNNIKFEVLE